MFNIVSFIIFVLDTVGNKQYSVDLADKQQHTPIRSYVVYVSIHIALCLNDSQ